MKKLSTFMIFTCCLFSLGFAQVTPAEFEIPTTTMAFENPEFDFGTVTQTDVVHNDFVFTNTGNEPLIITNVKGSCGCTVPYWPKHPIAPGESAVIEIAFNTKGKKNKQSKRITVTANTDPAQTFLTVRGIVEAPDEEKTINSAASKLESMVNFADVEKPAASECFAVFPNPTSDVVRLDLKEYIGQRAKITIVSPNGQVMTNRLLHEVTNGEIEFDVRDYSAGTYYLKIQMGDQLVSTRCFVVTR